jgi:hypothetical protein
MLGLAVFALVFAVNSAIHSYLVLAHTDEDFRKPNPLLRLQGGSAMNPQKSIRSVEVEAKLSLPEIATHWISELSRGCIRFDAGQVFTRSVYDDASGIEFKLIFNAARKNRGQSKAA